jgi:signal transduction histidine kinase
MMQQVVQAGTEDRKSVVGGTLAAVPAREESFPELAHDARNMVTALALYCELLEEPGVLAEGSRHFAQELRVVTAASWGLLEKLTRVEQRRPVNFAGTRAWRSSPLVEALPGTRAAGSQFRVEFGNCRVEVDNSFHGKIENLADELESNRNLLAALAGPGVTLRVKIAGGACPVALKGEDMTRLLVNLVRNATEAMHGSGSIRIGLAGGAGSKSGTAHVKLTIEDSGPGIPIRLLERVFEKGFSTHEVPTRTGARSRKATGCHGLGLAITRNLVEAAGGTISVGDCAAGGARIAIELPVLDR